MKRFLVLGVLAALMGGSVVVAGCGATGTPLDENYMEKGAADGEKILAIYEKVGGDESKLTPEDRKTLSDALGGDKGITQFFENVRNPRARGGAPGPTGGQ